MGVSSSGKSAVGKALARRLHAPFLDGDGYHPAANKEKMRFVMMRDWMKATRTYPSRYQPIVTPVPLERLAWSSCSLAMGRLHGKDPM